MAVVRLETDRIVDWNSFHLVSQEAFGFPEFYGMNMNAWIDCLTYLGDDDGMSNIVLDPDEDLKIVLSGSAGFAHRLPDIYAALVESVDFVNQRSVDAGERPRITLEFA